MDRKLKIITTAYQCAATLLANPRFVYAEGEGQEELKDKFIEWVDFLTGSMLSDLADSEETMETTEGIDISSIPMGPGWHLMGATCVSCGSQFQSELQSGASSCCHNCGGNQFTHINFVHFGQDE